LSADPDEQRRRSLEHWQEAAAGWERRQDAMRDFAGPVSHWLVEAIRPQPGHRVLDLAAGVGETGLLAAELVVPGGSVIISDQAEAMLEAARRRAQELGVGNVEFQSINAESIDLPVASIDAALCRWGYMLMIDPSAALAETRRVLRPGGRLALAVWDVPDRNPWLVLPGRVLIERGLTEPPEPGAPGPLALADRERLRDLLEEAGFEDVEIGAIDLEQRHPNFDSFWETTLDVSRNFHDAVLEQREPEIAEIRAALAERLAPFTAADGALAIPARTLVAAADA
jgi:SAM-dependent methyltransferase